MAVMERACRGGCGTTRTYLRARPSNTGRFVCDDCRPVRRRDTLLRHNATRPRGRERSLWDAHKMTVDEYDAMVSAQGGRCAGCGAVHRELHVDHAHDCENHPSERRSCAACRRGLLCADCNHALGMVADSPMTLRTLADYLERSTRHGR